MYCIHTYVYTRDIVLHEFENALSIADRDNKIIIIISCALIFGHIFEYTDYT